MRTTWNGPVTLAVDGVEVARAERITIHEGAELRLRGSLPIVGTEAITFTVDTRSIMLDSLKQTLVALDAAIDEAGNTRRGRALRRQARRVTWAIVRWTYSTEDGLTDGR